MDGKEKWKCVKVKSKYKLTVNVCTITGDVEKDIVQGIYQSSETL